MILSCKTGEREQKGGIRWQVRPLGGQQVVGLKLNPESLVLSTDNKLPCA